jgi:hypothetical protein
MYGVSRTPGTGRYLLDMDHWTAALPVGNRMVFSAFIVGKGSSYQVLDPRTGGGQVGTPEPVL